MGVNPGVVREPIVVAYYQFDSHLRKQMFLFENGNKEEEKKQ